MSDVSKVDVAREIPGLIFDWIRKAVSFLIPVVLTLAVAGLAIGAAVLLAEYVLIPGSDHATAWVISAWESRPGYVDSILGWIVNGVILVVGVWFYGSLAYGIWQEAKKRATGASESDTKSGGSE